MGQDKGGGDKWSNKPGGHQLANGRAPRGAGTSHGGGGGQFRARKSRAKGNMSLTTPAGGGTGFLKRGQMNWCTTQ